MTYICVGKLTIIAPDNGLSPGRRQAIIWTNVGILLFGPLGTKFNEISNEIHTFSFKKMHLNRSSAKWRPFFLGLNVLSMLLLWFYDSNTIYVLNMWSQLVCSRIFFLIEITIINIIVIIIINPYSWHEIRLKCKNCIQIYMYKTPGILVSFKRSRCQKSPLSLWHVWIHLSIYMMTSSNGNIFRVTGHLCVEFTGHRWIPRTKQVTRGFAVFFGLRLNKRVSKRSWALWFETPWRPLWRHCNVDPI